MTISKLFKGNTKGRLVIYLNDFSDRAIEIVTPENILEVMEKYSLTYEMFSGKFENEDGTTEANLIF